MRARSIVNDLGDGKPSGDGEDARLRIEQLTIRQGAQPGGAAAAAARTGTLRHLLSLPLPAARVSHALAPRIPKGIRMVIGEDAHHLAGERPRNS
uniref:Uncharacterized protein n=1 Tax=Leersia perrieri TaxID=77586 RepID=A0A0D9W5B4_9ORYZ